MKEMPVGQFVHFCSTKVPFQVNLKKECSAEVHFCPMITHLFFIPQPQHLKIGCVARVLAVDHIKAPILRGGRLGRVQVDAKDERQLA